MLYGEKLREICGKLGVDPNTLPDKLYSTLLNEICDCCGSGSGGGDDEALKGLIERSATSITIPDGTTSIGDRVFYNYSSLTSIEIPNSVTSIGEYAFYDCTSLTSVKFEENSQLTSIEGRAFYRCTSLTSIEIPNSVRIIGSSAFAGCTSLQEVTFEEGSQLLQIDTTAFAECTNLTSITIPDSVWLISYGAFNDCTSLTSIEIPNSVTSIGNNALYIGSSDNKATIRMTSLTPPTISTYTFDTSKLDKIEVPMSAVDTYKVATDWSNFADYIVGYEE